MCIDKTEACVNMAFQARRKYVKKKDNTMETTTKVAAAAKIPEDDHFRTGG